MTKRWSSQVVRQSGVAVGMLVLLECCFVDGLTWEPASLSIMCLASTLWTIKCHGATCWALEFSVGGLIEGSLD